MYRDFRTWNFCLPGEKEKRYIGEQFWTELLPSCLGKIPEGKRIHRMEENGKQATPKCKCLAWFRSTMYPDRTFFLR